MSPDRPPDPATGGVEGRRSPAAERHKALGVSGEQAVADWYQARGFTILARNWRSRTGEIDLIVRLGKLVVVCEVKTRVSNRFGAPEEAVTARKIQRIRRVAAEWLAGARASVDVRFDVASVTLKGRELVVEVIEGAFE